MPGERNPAEHNPANLRAEIDRHMADGDFELVARQLRELWRRDPAPDKISAESSPQSIESWDSMQHLNLVLAIEERFGLQFEPEEIEEMKNVGAAAGLVEKKLQSAAR